MPPASRQRSQAIFNDAKLMQAGAAVARCPASEASAASPKASTHHSGSARGDSYHHHVECPGLPTAAGHNMSLKRKQSKTLTDVEIVLCIF